jgi:hypothetical protein
MERHYIAACVPPPLPPFPRSNQTKTEPYDLYCTRSPGLFTETSQLNS